MQDHSGPGIAVGRGSDGFVQGEVCARQRALLHCQPRLSHQAHAWTYRRYRWHVVLAAAWRGSERFGMLLWAASLRHRGHDAMPVRDAADRSDGLQLHQPHALHVIYM